MTRINPDALPAQECRLIVADILEFMQHDGLPGEEDTLPTGMADRMLALAPKPSPWPMQLHGELVADLDRGGVSINIPAEETGFIEHHDMDRLVVAWLQHRGVDMDMVEDIVQHVELGGGLRGAGGEYGDEDSLKRFAEPMRRILDNATEAETHE